MAPARRGRRLDPLGLTALAALAAAAAALATGSAQSSLIVDTGASPEPPWLAGPLHGLGSALSPTSFSVWLLVMLASYTLLLARRRRVALGPIAATILAVHVLLALAPPLLSSDLFHYIGYTRLYVLHGLDPYVHAPASIPGDEFLPLIYWRHLTSPYGPVFTTLSLPLAELGRAGAVWTLKAAMALCSLGTVALVDLGARRRGLDRGHAAALVGLNPLLLVWGVGGAHNDLLLALMLTAALTAAIGGNRVAAGALGAIAVMVKLPGALVACFLLANAGRRRRTVLGAGTVIAASAVLSLLLFGRHALLPAGAVATGSRFVIDFSGADVIGRALGTGPTDTVRALAAAAAVATVATLLAGALRHPGERLIERAGWATLAVLLAVSTLEPWYVAWLLPLAALGRSARLRWATVAFTGVVCAVRLPLLGFDPLL